MDCEETKQKSDAEESAKEKKEDLIEDDGFKITDRVLNALEDAGPSSILPGAVPIPAVHKSNLQLTSRMSKSEQNIRHIFTANDIANALKLTTNSITSAAKTFNNTDFNITLQTIDDKVEDNNQIDKETNLVDLKKFMAACFKLNKEGSFIDEVSVQKVTTAVSAVNAEVPIITELTCSQDDTNGQTDTVINMSNEVIITPKPLSARVSKGSSDKKKTSGNLSERSDFGVTQRDSLSSIGSNVCRICMTRGRERLISPCNCKGSLANVHLSCLERWLNQVGRNHCELCGFSYPAIRTPRYTVLQALRLWFGNPRNRSHLQSDCLIFWLLSTVTAGLLAVCIVGTQYFVIQGNKFGKLDGVRKEEGLSHRITEMAMHFFMAIVLCGYSVTVYLLWKDHYVMWNRWRRANVNVRLLLSPDSNPVPFVPRPRYNI